RKQFDPPWDEQTPQPQLVRSNGWGNQLDRTETVIDLRPEESQEINDVRALSRIISTMRWTGDRNTRESHREIHPRGILRRHGRDRHSLLFDQAQLAKFATQSSDPAWSICSAQAITREYPPRSGLNAPSHSLLRNHITP